MQIEAFCIYGKRNAVALCSAIKIREITGAAAAWDDSGIEVKPEKRPKPKWKHQLRCRKLSNSTDR